jgi:D-3-phosphoglycerate dehydrogenase
LPSKTLITTSSFDAGNGAAIKLIEDGDLEYILNPFRRKLDETELIALLEQHKPEFLIAGTETISRKTLEISKLYLKIISRCGVGMDNVDLKAANELGIKVFNTPDAPTQAVAELTIGVMLDLLRNISKSDRGVRTGDFAKSMGALLSGKTVGIIGCGRIGSAVAKLVKSFGAIAIGYDKYLKTHIDITLLSFDELLARSDIISLHIPYSEEDRHIINASAIVKMKRGAILLNISRGGLVDEDALHHALISGAISSAGIDCFEGEPYSGKLTALENVVLTPHIGSYATEARLKQEIDSVKNILDNI